MRTLLQGRSAQWIEHVIDAHLRFIAFLVRYALDFIPIHSVQKAVL